MRRNRFEVDKRGRSGYVASSHSSWKNSTRFTGKCYTCGAFGHRAAFCVSQRVTPRIAPIASSVVCFKCNKQGHKAANCRMNVTNRLTNFVKCWNCGGVGHKSAQCRVRKYVRPQQKTVPQRGDRKQQSSRNTNNLKPSSKETDGIPKTLTDIEDELKEFVRCSKIRFMAESRRQRTWLAFDKAVDKVPTEYNYRAYNRVSRQYAVLEQVAKREGMFSTHEELRALKLEALCEEERDATKVRDLKYNEARAKARDKPWAQLFEDFCLWKDVQARDEGEEALLRVWEERQRWSKLVAERAEREKREKAEKQQVNGAREGSPPVEVKEARGRAATDESAVLKRVTTESAWLRKRCDDRVSKLVEARTAFELRTRPAQTD